MAKTSFLDDICAEIAGRHFNPGDRVKVFNKCFGLNDKDFYRVATGRINDYLPIADESGKLLGSWRSNRFKKVE